MQVFPVLLAAAFSITQTSAHDSKNTLFHELVTKGVPVGNDAFVPLPAPLMADGLDAAAQTNVLRKLANDQYRLEDILRDSQLAKHFHKITQAKVGDPDSSAHRIDVWFVAHGDLDRLAAKDPREIFYLGRKDVKVEKLSKADLAKHNLESGDGESFLHITYSVFDEVQVAVTSRNMLTKTADSVVVAQRLEPAFTKDGRYPNQWQRLKEGAGNKLEPVGTPAPYQGFGQYMKFTRLAEPRGAIFVEYHQLFAEPKSWFESPNVVRTKLPLIVQGEVRNFRRELKKWSSGK